MEKCVEVGSSGIKGAWHMVPAVPCPSTQEKKHLDVTRLACSLTSRSSWGGGGGKVLRVCGLYCSCFRGTEGGAHGTAGSGSLPASGLTVLGDIQFCSCTYEDVSLA
jgi:hypothetical protein